MSITRSDLIKRLAERHPQLPTADIEQSVRVIQDTMANTLSNGGRVEIRGFGSFSLHYRKARVGRNPKTGEQVNLAGKYVPHFKPSKELNLRMDEE